MVKETARLLQLTVFNTHLLMARDLLLRSSSKPLFSIPPPLLSLVASRKIPICQAHINILHEHATLKSDVGEFSPDPDPKPIIVPQMAVAVSPLPLLYYLLLASLLLLLRRRR